MPRTIRGKRSRRNPKNVPTADTGVKFTSALAMKAIVLFTPIDTVPSKKGDTMAVDLQVYNQHKQAYRWVLRSFAKELREHGMRLHVDPNYYRLYTIAIDDKGEKKWSERHSQRKSEGIDYIARVALSVMYPEASAA